MRDEQLGGATWWYDKCGGIWGPSVSMDFHADGTLSFCMKESNNYFSAALEPLDLRTRGRYELRDDNQIEVSLDKPLRGQHRFVGSFCRPGMLRFDGLPGPLTAEENN